MRYDKENTLFVTDMDGTLLGTDSLLSGYTVDVLREVLSRGYNFTVASGRMPESPIAIFRECGLELKLPVIGRNGVLIFDPVKGEYVKIRTMPREASERILQLIREQNAQMFLCERAEGGRSIFNKRGMEGFEKSLGDLENMTYMTADGSYEQLSAIYDEAMRLPGVGGLLFNDEFFSPDPDMWFAEFFSVDAGKGSGIRFVKELCGFGRTVCFGDNINDLSMFEASDEGFAPENAEGAVKAVATAVIAANSEDGVAHWLEENLLR